MVIYDNRQENSIYLVELTVPFESNVSKAHDRKHKKYLGVVSDINDNGFICDLMWTRDVDSLHRKMLDTLIVKIFSFVCAMPKKTYFRNSSNWLSCTATQSGMIDSSWLGAPKTSP